MISRDKFRDLYCMMCGSQRCDASDEMMNYCKHFREENFQTIRQKCEHVQLCKNISRLLNMFRRSEFISADVLKR